MKPLLIKIIDDDDEDWWCYTIEWSLFYKVIARIPKNYEEYFMITRYAADMHEMFYSSRSLM